MIRALKSFWTAVGWAVLEMVDFDQQVLPPGRDMLCIRDVLFTPDRNNSLLVGFVVWDPACPEVRGCASLTKAELLQLLQPFNDRGYGLNAELFPIVFDLAMRDTHPNEMDEAGWTVASMNTVRFGTLDFIQRKPGATCQEQAQEMVEFWLRRRSSSHLSQLFSWLKASEEMS